MTFVMVPILLPVPLLEVQLLIRRYLQPFVQRDIIFLLRQNGSRLIVFSHDKTIDLRIIFLQHSNYLWLEYEPMEYIVSGGQMAYIGQLHIRPPLLIQQIVLTSMLLQ